MFSCVIKHRTMKKGNAKLLIRNLRKMEENKQLNIDGVIISIMEDLKSEIRKIIDKPPTKKVKCGCNGYDVKVGYEPDGPNPSDWGRAIYGRCCSGIQTVKDTDKMIELIAELLTSQK